MLSIETVGKIWEMLNFSTCSVTVISSMRVDNRKGEGKRCPVTCQVTTEDRLRYRSNHTRPWWQKGAGGQPHAPASLPCERDLVPLVQEAGGPWGWSGWISKISHTLRFKPQTIQPVVRHYIDYTILTSHWKLFYGNCN